MSNPSQTPPGNRLPSGRVFRPFAGGGGAAGQGTPQATPPATPMRRPGQPFRPFVGAQSPQIEPVEPAASPTATIATVAEPIVEPTPPPVHEEDAPIAHEAWETYFTPEPKQQVVVNGSAPDPVAPMHSSEITVEVPQIEDAKPRLDAEQSSVPESVAPKFSSPITVEVPAIPSEEAMAAIRDVAHEGDLWEAAYSAATPSDPQPTPDVVLDEVEAAFESVPPSSGESSRLDDALVAAATLEAIARRLRDGDVEIRLAPGASTSNQESVLATVLAALLANR